MTKEMMFDHIFATVFGIIILVSAVLFVFNYSFNMTGSAILSYQPNAANGTDTYLRENFGTNFGEAAAIKVGKTSGGLELKGLVQFNLSSIDSGDSVTDAKLQIYLSGFEGQDNITINISRIASEWNETFANWTARNSSASWSSEGGDYSGNFVSQIIGNVSGYYNFTITSLVQGWVNTSYENYGLILISSNAANNDIHEFSSSDNPAASQRPLIFIDHIANAAPAFNSLSTNSSLAAPKQIGDLISFTINWSDLENDNSQVFICNSSNINASGCKDTILCNTSRADTNPVSCSYTAINADNRTQNFWAAVCDSGNCSAANMSQFFVNHAPNIIIVQPDGGETVNQSLGNYNIQFNVSDADKDSLTADLYYGITQNSTANAINAGLNLSDYCTDSDADASTANNCSYSWNSTGIYGAFFMTIIINDSFSAQANDSSDASFEVRSLSDDIAPNITAQWIDGGTIYSGRQINFYANVSEENIQTVWVEINTTPPQNLTMSNTTDIQFNAAWEAVEAGVYQFKVYANDTIGNLNNSLAYIQFSISKPSAASQNITAAPTALPYSVIKINGELNATDSLKNVYAYLTVPDGFTFLQDYPQNTFVGNFSANQTKNAAWFLSSPLTESTYIVNITYTDNFSNSWNSSNAQVQVTSAIGGGYSINVEGYPEAAKGNTSFSEAAFRSGGTLANADSMTIRIYDSAGSLTLGPVAMNNPETGTYNYSYTVGASANEGIWETIVNATKDGVSYYANFFWQVVGGLFDVRDIVIDNPAVSSLQISVTTENVGNIQEDLSLTWNLTRADTGAQLDAGADTFAVSAKSTQSRTVYPTTAYVGQVQITFIGYYGVALTRKAGAYRIFSTTSDAAAPAPSGGGGGGGAAPITAAAVDEIINFSIEKFPDIITLSKNLEKELILEIENVGDITIKNISLKLDGLEDYAIISPQAIGLIKPGKTKEFAVQFLVADFIGEKDFNYIAASNELTKTKPAILIVLSMKDFFTEEFEQLNHRIEILKLNITEAELLDELKNCEAIVADISSDIKEENFLSVQDKIKDAESCIDKVEEKSYRKKFITAGVKDIIYLIFTGIIAMILILFIVLIGYKFYKKIGILSFLKKEQEKGAESQVITAKQEDIDSKIKSIEERLKE